MVVHELRNPMQQFIYNRCLRYKIIRVEMAIKFEKNELSDIKFQVGLASAELNK